MIEAPHLLPVTEESLLRFKDHPSMVRVNGVAYFEYPKTLTTPPFLTGASASVRFFSGRLLEATNLWKLGPSPYNLEDNATFLP